MNLWSVAATLFAAASFIAIVWQILRFEATRPMLEWSLGFSMPGEVVDGTQAVQLRFRPCGPIVIHEVEGHEWGAARVDYVTERARMDCDSEDLVAEATWLVGHEAFLGFSWLEPSLIRRTPVRQAIRRRVPDGGIQVWKWYRIPRPTKWRQGRWVEQKVRQQRRTFVPDMWGMPGSR